MAIVIGMSGVLPAEDISLLITGSQKIARKSGSVTDGPVAVVYRPEEMMECQVRENVVFSPGRAMDIYYPPDFSFDGSLPVVVVVNSFSNLGYKNCGRCIDWGLLLASCGIAAVTYEPCYAEKDTQDLLNYLNNHGNDLSLDHERIGLLSYCGNTLLGFKVAMQKGKAYSNSIKIGAFLCGYIPTMDDLRDDVTIVIVRPGRSPGKGLSESISQFENRAETENLPCRIIEHPTGSANFDYIRTTGQDNLYSIGSLHPDDCAIINEVLTQLKTTLTEGT